MSQADIRHKPISDSQLLGEPSPSRLIGPDVCPVHGTPCSAWDAMSKQCLSGVCVHDLRHFAAEYPA